MKKEIKELLSNCRVWWLSSQIKEIENQSEKLPAPTRYEELKQNIQIPAYEMKDCIAKKIWLGQE